VLAACWQLGKGYVSEERRSWWFAVSTDLLKEDFFWRP